MIRVYKDYVVLIDTYGYTAAIDTGKDTKSKDGKITRVYKNIGYYSQLRAAIKGIAEYDTKRTLQDTDVTLLEACEIVKNINNELEKILERVKE